MLEQPENRYAMPARYHETTPLASGYISSENQERIKGTAGLIVGAMGSGRINNPTSIIPLQGILVRNQQASGKWNILWSYHNGQATQR